MKLYKFIFVILVIFSGTCLADEELMPVNEYLNSAVADIETNALIFRNVIGKIDIGNIEGARFELCGWLESYMLDLNDALDSENITRKDEVKGVLHKIATDGVSCAYSNEASQILDAHK